MQQWGLERKPWSRQVVKWSDISKCNCQWWRWGGFHRRHCNFSPRAGLFIILFLLRPTCNNIMCSENFTLNLMDTLLSISLIYFLLLEFFLHCVSWISQNSHTNQVKMKVSLQSPTCENTDALPTGSTLMQKKKNKMKGRKKWREGGKGRRKEGK